MKTLISPSKSPETTTSPVRSIPAPGGIMVFLDLLKNTVFTFTMFFSPGYSLQQEVGNRSKKRARNNGSVGFDGFVVVISVLSRCDRLRRKMLNEMRCRARTQEEKDQPEECGWCSRGRRTGSQNPHRCSDRLGRSRP